MLKTFLTTTALTAFVAAAATAQETAPTDPVVEPDAPAAAQDEGMTDTGTDPLVTQDDPAAGSTDPMMTQDDPATDSADPMTDSADPMVTQDEPAAGATDPMVTQDDPAAGSADPMMADDGLATEGAIELSAIPADELIGSDVRTYEDEQVANVDDVIFSPEGEVQALVVTFGGFLGFGTSTVEVMPEEVEIFRDESDNIIVRTSLTPETLEGRPDYEG